MKKRHADAIIDKYDIVLLKNSGLLPSEYAELYGFIQDKDVVLECDIASLSVETKDLLNNKALRAELLNLARAEWVYDSKASAVIESEHGEKFTCQLCGNVTLKTMFELKNTVTGNSLFIGSECKKNFSAHVNKGINEYLNDRRYLKNLQTIMRDHPNYQPIVEKCEKALANEQYLTKEPIYTNLRKGLSNAKANLKQYRISKKRSSTAASESMGLLLENLENALNAFMDWQKECKKMVISIPSSYFRPLSQAEQGKLRRDGALITVDNFIKFNSEEMMKGKWIPMFKQLINHNHISEFEYAENGGRGIYKYHLVSVQSIELFISHTQLPQIFVSHLMNNKQINELDVISHSHPMNNDVKVNILDSYNRISRIHYGYCTNPLEVYLHIGDKYYIAPLERYLDMNYNFLMSHILGIRSNKTLNMTDKSKHEYESYNFIELNSHFRKLREERRVVAKAMHERYVECIQLF
jgi:hypothetical protein